MNISFRLLLILLAAPFLSNAQYSIDIKKSSVKWHGYYLFSFGEHYGSIAIREGNATTSNGMVTSGKVVLDMNSITTLDMPADDGGNMLTNHLKSADFFDVPNFPEAIFEIISVTKIQDASPGGPNVDVTGTLTLKGIKNTLTFPATVTAGDQLMLNAKFKFDRTKWDVKYSSGKYFSEIGDSAISDAIGIELNILATKTSSK